MTFEILWNKNSNVEKVKKESVKCLRLPESLREKHCWVKKLLLKGFYAQAFYRLPFITLTILHVVARAFTGKVHLSGFQIEVR